MSFPVFKCSMQLGTVPLLEHWYLSTVLRVNSVWCFRLKVVLFFFNYKNLAITVEFILCFFVELTLCTNINNNYSFHNILLWAYTCREYSDITYLKHFVRRNHSNVECFQSDEVHKTKGGLCGTLEITFTATNTHSVLIVCSLVQFHWCRLIAYYRSVLVLALDAAWSSIIHHLVSAFS